MPVPMDAQMILVAGPPCGGKTTYVRAHADATDVVLDFDDIVEHITGDRYARTPAVMDQARREWKDALPQADWVIWTAPRRQQRGRIRTQYDATIVVVTASFDTCLRRASDARPPLWQTMVRTWFAEWEPSRSGREQIVDTTHA